jgi:hypothetical protein
METSNKQGMMENLPEIFNAAESFSAFAASQHAEAGQCPYMPQVAGHKPWSLINCAEYGCSAKDKGLAPALIVSGKGNENPYTVCEHAAKYLGWSV